MLTASVILIPAISFIVARSPNWKGWGGVSGEISSVIRGRSIDIGAVSGSSAFDEIGDMIFGS
jgi:hypothetical protein